MNKQLLPIIFVNDYLRTIKFSRIPVEVAVSFKGKHFTAPQHLLATKSEKTAQRQHSAEYNVTLSWNAVLDSLICVEKSVY